MKSILLKALPHVLAILSFLIISSFFYSPAISGKKIKMGDIENWKGMAKENMDYYNTYGDDSMWTNSMFSGMPSDQILVKDRGNLIKNLDKIYKLGLPRPIDILFKAMLGFYILLMCLRITPTIGAAAAISFGLSSVFVLYIDAGHATKMISLGYIAPMIGGIIYAFRNSIWKGALITALFLALQISSNHLQMTYYALFLVVIVAIGEVIRLGMNNELKSLPKLALFLIGAGILGVLPNYSMLSSTAEYGKYSTRGESELTISPDAKSTQMSTTTKSGLAKDYILEYSMSTGEWFSAYLPNVKGGKAESLIMVDAAKKAIKSRQMKDMLSQNPASSYWGEQKFSGGAFYFGALMFFLALCCLIMFRDVLSYSLSAVALISIMASWKLGSIPDFFIDYVPLWDKFRDTKMMLVLLMIIIPLMGALFLNKFLSDKEFRVSNKTWLFGTIGGFLLLNIIMLSSPETVFDFSSSTEAASFKKLVSETPQAKPFVEAIKQGRIGIFLADLSRSLGFFLVGAGILVLAIFKSDLAKYLGFGFALMFLVDMWNVDQRYSENRVFESAKRSAIPFPLKAADESILQLEKGNIPDFNSKQKAVTKVFQENSGIKKNSEKYQKQRQMETLSQNSNYRVLNLAGTFSDSRTSYYHKSIGGYHGAKLKIYMELIDFHLGKEINNIISKLQSGQQPSGDNQVLNMLNTKYFIGNPDGPAIPNPGAMGNAWFVESLNVVKDADEEILKLNDVQLTNTAVIQEQYAQNLASSYAASGTISMTDYKPNKITYTVNSASKAFAVFSEIYYPASWVAYIDGKQVDFQKVNYVLRGLEIPVGAKEIVFKCEASTHFTGKTISLIGSFILILLLLFGGFMIYKENKKIASINTTQTK